MFPCFGSQDAILSLLHILSFRLSLSTHARVRLSDTTGVTAGPGSLASIDHALDAPTASIFVALCRKHTTVSDAPLQRPIMSPPTSHAVHKSVHDFLGGVEQRDTCPFSVILPETGCM